MSDNLEQIVARTIDEHIVYHGAPNQRSACKCGHLFEARMPHSEHVGHVAAMVLAAQREAGYAVEQLSALQRIRELHHPRWDNCINACCPGALCKHRTQVCDHDYEEWPCPTMELLAADEVTA